MCEICLHSPCLTQCPNKVDKHIHTCVECKEPIYSGDEYASIDNEIYCKYCLEGMTLTELMSKLKYPIEIAKEDTDG